MPNALIRKLRHAGCLAHEDEAVLLRACANARDVAARQDLTCEGDRPENVHLVLQGIACRYKVLPKGRRQITALLVPGDFCDLHVAILERMDHSIATVTPCTVARLPRATIEELTAGYPRIARALWWATLVDEAILRAWLVNMGQRQADRQMAHLFCELEARLGAVGLVERAGGAATFAMPLRQADVADLLGMTDVHVNRSLKELRAAGHIVLQQRRKSWCAVASTIPSMPRVRAMPCYFIDTDDGRLHVIDDEGHDLADPAAARDLAHEALSNMARDGLTGAERRGFSARVRTEDGSTIYTASLTLDGKWWVEQPIT